MSKFRLKTYSSHTWKVVTVHNREFLQKQFNADIIPTLWWPFSLTKARDRIIKYWKKQTTIGNKISWEILLQRASQTYAYLKRENKAFPSLPPPCNIVLLFEIPIENSKHLNFEWRGGERGVNCFVLKVTQFEDNVSSILSPIVDDGNSPWEVLTAYISHNIDHVLHLGWYESLFLVYHPLDRTLDSKSGGWFQKIP